MPQVFLTLRSHWRTIPTMKFSVLLFALLVAMVGFVRADAQASLVGDVFSSESAGISFRPPAGSIRANSAAQGLVAEFDDPDRHWELTVTTLSLPRPVPLSQYKDQFGDTHDGLLDLTVSQLQQQPSAVIVMQDMIHVGTNGRIAAGTLVARCSQNGQRRLIQQALVAVNDKSYYIVELNTPARADENATGDDPGERLAGDTFNQVLDSIDILDRSAIRQDQMDRLFRTRGLLANWTADFLQSKMIPQQYFRLLRDGKDVGYIFEVDEYDDGVGRIGGAPIVRISMRNDSTPKTGTVIDEQSRLIVTVDRKHETWSNLALIVSPPPVGSPADAKPIAQQVVETGMSDQSLKAVPVVAPGAGLDVPAPGDQPAANPIQPGVTLREAWTLTVVRRVGSASPPAFRQDVDPWYLPQAMSYLLPRLLPYKEPKTYLFDTYEPQGDNGKPAVMRRYVDVMPISQVDFDGKQIMAVTVKDHIGIDGPVTMHYLDAGNGSYLGSVVTIPAKDAASEPTTEMILPSDEATLRQLWPNANLTRPDRIVDGDQVK